MQKNKIMKNYLFINKKVWGEFTLEEMEQYQKAVYTYYRKTGFPYFSTDTLWRQKELTKALKYDYTKCIDQDNKIIKQTMHGLSYCWSFHPHHYEVSCNNMKTVKEAFDSDEMLKGVISKRIKMGDNMSDNGLRKMLKIYSGVQCVSNFRPTAAAAIYTQFAPKNGIVYDMSAGFGGRALGAYLADVTYIGVDPSTKSFEGVSQMIQELGSNKHVLYKQGSESTTPLDGRSVDLCFTSPPYFDCEKYSNEITQSYIKYPTKETWLNGFLKDTLVECKRVLKEEGKIVLNIQNVKSYPTLTDDFKEMIKSINLYVVDEWGIHLSSLAKGGYKTEPLYVLKECK